MFHKITLMYSADATNAAPSELEAVMGAVPLYSSATQDPVLGQYFGLTVESDSMGLVGQTATRTIVLHMDPAAGAPEAPPFFPISVQVKDGQAAVYSTSDEDALVNPTTGLAGSGAQTVSITYEDAEGNVGVVGRLVLNGRIPVIIPLAGGTGGIVQITAWTITSTGATGNSIGELTIAVYTPPPPGIDFPPANTPELRDFMQNMLGVPKADRIGLEQTKYVQKVGVKGLSGPVSGGRAAAAIAFIPPSYYTYAPTPATQVALLTNFFTATLQLALTVKVTAATPVLS